MKAIFERDDGWTYEFENPAFHLGSRDGMYYFDGHGYSMTVKKEEEMTAVPELYLEDLQTLQKVMERLEDFSISGVFAVEIKVKVDDTNTWAVIGWGEAGDPCLLRFEKET